MEQHDFSPSRKMLLSARSAAVAAFFSIFPSLPDAALLAAARRLFGSNRYPLGQKFLEKAMLTLKTVLREANPQSRKKLKENLFVNECVRGQAVRERITETLGFEVPVLLVISPTMRCPLHCYGCYSAQYSRDADLDPAVLDLVLTEAKSLGIYFFVISGGEPFVYPRIMDLFEKHHDAWFQVYTSGILLDPAMTGRLAKLGNVMPCISVEGFEAETDRRRGKGHFAKVLTAFENLRAGKVPFGFSATATRENNDLITSDSFVDFYQDQGASVGWYFQYMPIGREPNLDLVPTPRQRIDRLHRILGLRERYDLLLADFWNDGPLVGGCLAGARRYLHINHKGDIEPCVFCQIATENIYTTGLLRALKTSPLFRAIRKRQPYSDNLLRPCMIIDTPQVLRDVVAEAHPYETCGYGAARLMGDLYPELEKYAREYGQLADEQWRLRYQEAYEPIIREAHELSAAFEDTPPRNPSRRRGSRQSKRSWSRAEPEHSIQTEMERTDGDN